MRWLGGIFLVCLCAAIRAHTLPVDWDAGACSGGHATHIFDKYEDELVRIHSEEIVEQREIVSVKAIRGTQTAEWENRSIQLAFNVQYEYEDGSAVTNRIAFAGQRYWYDSFSWTPFGR